MGQKKITFYFDCVSPYSYHAFTYLMKHKETLKSLAVELDMIPVFLGGINVGSGNKPPWTLPAKAAYSKFDGERAGLYFGNTFKTPSFFPILSLLPQRALVHIKAHFPTPKFHASMQSLYTHMWEQHSDISIPANLTKALESVFSADEARVIVERAGDVAVKAKLTANTEEAWKQRGAFGAPWFWVEDGDGRAEPFFGSDRWAYMWRFLGLEFEDVRLRGRL